MSLAQRRTALDGIETIPATIPEHAIPDDEAATFTDVHTNRDIRHRDRRESATSNPPSIPAEDGNDVWRTFSYDPFSAPKSVELHHYESFPLETVDNVAAYDVSSTRRICQILFAVTVCVLASGIVCGFAALKPVLIAEGVYHSLCPSNWPSDSQIPCPEQNMRLNLFFIVGSVSLNVSTMLAGYVLDNHGRRACYLLAAGVLLLGSACTSLAFYLGDRWWWLHGYIAGNLLLGLGGTFLFVSSYQLSNAFPRHAGMIVALITGAFDASAAVFLFYRLAYERTGGWPRPESFFAVFGVLVSLAIVVAETTDFMPRAPYTTRREYQVAIAAAQDPTRDEHDSDDETFAGQPRVALVRAREVRAEEREAQLEAIESVTGGAEARRADREAARKKVVRGGVEGVLVSAKQEDGGHPGAGGGVVARSAVAAQMATPWFWLLLASTMLQMTRMNYFIATIRTQYRHMLGGDEDAAARVNGLFDVALPVAGVASTPVIGVLLGVLPVWATLALVTVLVAALGVLNCIPSLWAGYATIVAFVLFRPLYYSAVSDYATKVFGFATFGRIYGTVTCVSGAAQLAQPALDAFVHGVLLDNPIPLNAFFAIMGTMLSGALAIFVYVKTRRASGVDVDGEDGEECRPLLEQEDHDFRYGSR